MTYIVSGGALNSTHSLRTDPSVRSELGNLKTEKKGERHKEKWTDKWTFIRTRYRDRCLQLYWL